MKQNLRHHHYPPYNIDTMWLAEEGEGKKRFETNTCGQHRYIQITIDPFQSSSLNSKFKHLDTIREACVIVKKEKKTKRKACEKFI